ncbi:MAG TPA: GTP 3',8-cyclase MoaA [Burkholderiales bacterium]
MPPPPLKDRFGRTIEYLRLSVTDRCDLRCSYCMPRGFAGFEEPEHWLSFDEIERLAGAFAALGVRRLRLTGGEPLLRRGITDLARRLRSLDGIEDLSLSTNATQLARHARALRDAGVTRLNVSLDTLDRKRFARITGRDALPRVLAGLGTARDCGFAPIKLNMVLLREVNETDVDSMVQFCIEHGFVLRLIEAMPVGDTGRAAGFVSLQPVIERLQREFGLVKGIIPGGGPARYLKSPDGRFSLGFITPLSQHFCAACNRVRLAVDGTLHLCLGQEHSFRFGPLLRRGAGAAKLAAAIREAIELKPERHEFRDRPGRILRIMAQTGG